MSKTFVASPLKATATFKATCAISKDGKRVATFHSKEKHTATVIGYEHFYEEEGELWDTTPVFMNASGETFTRHRLHQIEDEACYIFELSPFEDELQENGEIPEGAELKFWVNLESIDFEAAR